MEVEQGVRGDSEEGQSASGTVHIHRYSVRDGRGGAGGGRGGDGGSRLIVPDGVTADVGAVQTPGLIVPSKHNVVNVSFPLDSSVTH